MIRIGSTDSNGHKAYYDPNKVYYVYAWYYVDTGEIFYVGKGKNNRYKERKVHRNKYFQNILAKHGDNVDVRFLMENLNEEDALSNERRLISEYKAIGQCKANFHEGGCGGNTCNYDSPERRMKLSIAAKKHGFSGSKNPMFGKHHSRETCERFRQIWAERRIAINARKEEERRKKMLLKLLPKHLSKRHYFNMMVGQSLVYSVHHNDALLQLCIGHSHLETYFKSKFGVGFGVVKKIMAGNYHPTFSRLSFLQDIRISKIDPRNDCELLNLLGGNVEREISTVCANPKHERHRSGVIQYDLSGKELNRFSSLKEAEAKTGCNATNICKCCRGVYRQHGGFVWKCVN